MSRHWGLQSLSGIADLFLGVWQRVPAPVLHNLAKAHALKLAFWHANLEQLDGCYVEFGVATGNSLRAAEIAEKTAYAPSLGIARVPRRLFGFDTFESFSSQSPDDEHPVWQGDRFSASYETVSRRFRRDIGRRIQLFKVDASLLSTAASSLPTASDALNGGPCAIALFDMDLGQPTLAALEWLEPMFVDGSIVIFDEYCAFGGNPASGEAGAFASFIDQSAYISTLFLSYGDGGRAFILSRQASGSGN